MPLAPEIVNCSSWGALEAIFEAVFGSEPYNWLFRGHCKQAWGLQPRLERECALDRIPGTELRLYDDFRSKAHLYSPQVPPLEDVVSWLSAMQHHGVPTRLLDWSYSAYVALFFAAEKAKDEDFALWAIRRDPLVAISRKWVEHLFGFPNEAILEAPELFRQIAAFAQPFPDDTAGLVVPILPKFHVSRLSSQQGCFLVNCNHPIRFEDSLAEMMKSVTSDWLYKILVPQSLRSECLKRLMHFNIHPVSLYPDLEGLGKFITLKNELFPVS
jgi:hypothetical protein